MSGPRWDGWGEGDAREVLSRMCCIYIDMYRLKVFVPIFGMVSSPCNGLDLARDQYPYLILIY